MSLTCRVVKQWELLFTLKLPQAQGVPKLQIGNTEISHRLGVTPSSPTACRPRWRRLSRSVSRWASHVSNWWFHSCSGHLLQRLTILIVTWVRISQVSCYLFLCTFKKIVSAWAILKVSSFPAVNQLAPCSAAWGYSILGALLCLCLHWTSWGSS